MAGTQRDVFICHASEDKEQVVRPLVDACNEAGISCWYDEAEIEWGDSITQKVDEGLARSSYVVVVFSAAFVEKNWPRRELNAILNQEASTGEVKVLPLLVGSERDRQNVLAKFPLLNDKHYLPWDAGLRGIVSALLSRLNRTTDKPEADAVRVTNAPGLAIPFPKIRKQFTQRDRDIFLRDAFALVKGYFQNALQELERHYQEVQTDFTEVHSLKFLATIYVRGEVRRRCKIWLGGFTSCDSIGYKAGDFNVDEDNSFNEILSVADDEDSLGFSPPALSFGRRPYAEDELLSAQQVGEYLWTTFTQDLG